MVEWFSLTEQQRKNIFNQVSIQTGLPAIAVEKDWWVTLVLRTVFSLSVAEHLVFKGGTSLSKGWDLIERFSEDIDLALDRRFLGFEGDLSKTQVKKLRKVSCGFISGDFMKAVEARLKELDIPDVTLSVQDFNDFDTDPLVIELNYKALTDQSAYIQPRVLIEIGSRSLMEPFEERDIQSLVGKQYSEQSFADRPIAIPTVLPKRTFLEKIFLLHEEFQKPAEHIRVDRLSRHLYDLEKLMDTDHGKEAIVDDELYNSIIAHRKKFNIVRGIEYKNHRKDNVNFIPPEEILKDWEKDYQTMQESMIYGETLSFDKLIKRLEKLRERLR
ncbi:nucleotidyl transferase AbiEii/AbiGii toxin family protein [Marivirga atlantica]|jgi:predicted nucleotidyltransferase component of viral defense system|uniref:Nucleotidyl transferase AbiEii/AbiGii toxin family protein n=1 Tax=Marivirga atlantica TaxID=1548457 RepID=A0A937AKD0_9BACT|nr:nucleotidyl transferase AbiEii/AbiGii toxin family protein [Marivirga atlantica]MBL0767094.1 nucleotidyl transferase AbiEii/AbiGii toxin family protein [Marivirga atlantica]